MKPSLVSYIIPSNASTRLPSLTQFFINMALSNIINVDLLQVASNANYFAELAATNITEPAISLLAYHPDFYELFGSESAGRQVWHLPWEAFHEGGIYNHKTNSLYILSNYQSLEDNINVTVVSLESSDYPFHSTQFENLAMGNGGTNVRSVRQYPAARANR